MFRNYQRLSLLLVALASLTACYNNEATVTVHPNSTSQLAPAKATETVALTTPPTTPASEYMLGHLYLEGRGGVPANPDQAFYWIEKAADHNYLVAKKALGYLFLNGIGTQRDVAEGLNWTNEAAEAGDSEAQLTLAKIYSTGAHGVPVDLAQAFKWYQRAAEQGSAIAQAQLGYMYSHGEGVTQDPQAGFNWTLKAAQQGLAIAQYSIAVAYHNGDGVTANYQTSYEWLQKAAQQGYQPALNKLAAAKGLLQK